MERTIRETAMLANLSALRRTLAIALAKAAEAETAMQGGNTNQAIGAALGIEAIIGEAAALYGAAIALHRNRIDDAGTAR